MGNQKLNLERKKIQLQKEGSEKWSEKLWWKTQIFIRG